MTHDWSSDVKKFVPDADEVAIKGIVKHCGISLQNRDASYVVCSDNAERDRVRDGFLKKKLALTASNDELDKAVLDVCAAMKAERDKPRVTFYYLLAVKYGKLALFH